MRNAVAVLIALVACSSSGESLDPYLKKHGATPAAYILAKLETHRIVIAGENHWQRADAELIRDLVPELRRRNVALAIETFQASSQSEIDALIAAPERDRCARTRSCGRRAGRMSSTATFSAPHGRRAAARGRR